MSGPSAINQWPAVNATPPATRIKRPVAPEVEERLMLARLFGHQTQEAQPPVKAPAAAPKSDDNLAPNLGRHLDVTA